MKKIHLMVSVLGLLALACSTTSLLPAAAPTVSVPTVSLPTEASQQPTSLPTPTLTFTPTPTLVLASATQPTTVTTSTPASTATEASATNSASTGTTTVPTTASPTPTFTQIPPTPQGPVFTLINLSGNQMYWGDTCQQANQPDSIIFTAQIANGFNVDSVLLFTRLQSQSGNTTTVWNKAISMHDDGLGSFTYILTLDVIQYYQQFNNANVEYQLVATNTHGQVVGRTQVYSNNLTLTRCP